MNILFLAPKYMGLYEPIKIKLEENGHNVVYIEDITPSFYPYYRRNGLRDIIYKTVHVFRNLDKKYEDFWNKIILEHNLLDTRFDLFFCINGTSLHPYFLDRIIKKNPDMRRTLYIWDTNKYYNFEWYLHYFNNAFTFDKSDARELSINYLPFYYVQRDNCNYNLKYDAFCIGSLHDGRLAILDSISKQMDKLGLKYYFKIVYLPIPNKLLSRITLKLRSLIEDGATIQEREYKMGLRKHSLLTTTPYSIDEFNSLMLQSKVIIDTDRETQLGLTPRLVWALANGKSVITTNVNLKNSVYCPKDKIWFIDRNNPQLTPKIFENLDGTTCVNEQIKQLEINNWITNFVPD